MSSTTDPGRPSAARPPGDDAPAGTGAATPQEPPPLVSPGQLFDQALGLGRGGHAGSAWPPSGAREEAPPLPLLLLGAGLGWLMLGGDPRRRGTAGRAAAAQGAAGPAPRATASDAAPASSEAVNGDPAPDQVPASGAGQPGLDGLVRDHPLVLGTLGVAVGAALGALLPRGGSAPHRQGRTDGATDPPPANAPAGISVAGNPPTAPVATGSRPAAPPAPPRHGDSPDEGAPSRFPTAVVPTGAVPPAAGQGGAGVPRERPPAARPSPSVARDVLSPGVQAPPRIAPRAAGTPPVSREMSPAPAPARAGAPAAGQRFGDRGGDPPPVQPPLGLQRPAATAAAGAPRPTPAQPVGWLGAAINDAAQQARNGAADPTRAGREPGGPEHRAVGPPGPGPAPTPLRPRSG